MMIRESLIVEALHSYRRSEMGTLGSSAGMMMTPEERAEVTERITEIEALLRQVEVSDDFPFSISRVGEMSLRGVAETLNWLSAELDVYRQRETTWLNNPPTLRAAVEEARMWRERCEQAQTLLQGES
jgi:hypothetical protein